MDSSAILNFTQEERGPHSPSFITACTDEVEFALERVLRDHAQSSGVATTHQEIGPMLLDTLLMSVLGLD